MHVAFIDVICAIHNYHHPPYPLQQIEFAYMVAVKLGGLLFGVVLFGKGGANPHMEPEYLCLLRLF